MNQPQLPDRVFAGVMGAGGTGVSPVPGDPTPASRAVPPVPWPNVVNRLFWAALAVLVACLAYRSATRGLRVDESETIHTAWLVSQGERPYVDFFQHHHPLLYYVLSPVVAACGERVGTLVACRLVTLLFMAGILAATYWLATRLFDRSAALLAALCLITCSGFIERALEVRPDVPQTLFGLLAIVLFFPKEGPVRARSYFFAGLCLGVAMLFLQKAVFTIAALGAVLLYRLARKEAKLTDLAACAAGGFLALLPFGIWLAVWNSPGEYYFLNWTLNQHSLDRFSILPAAMNVYHDSTLLFVFAAVGATLFLVNARQRELVAVAAILLASLFVVRAPYGQYWIPIFPLVAVLAGHGLAAVWRDRPRMAALFLAFVVVLPVTTGIHQALHGNYLSLWKQWEKSAYVLAVAGPNDRVYDGQLSFNFFRHDIDYLWLVTSLQLETYQALRPYPYDVYRLIDEKRPKVVSSFGIANMEDVRIRGHYKKSDRYEDLFIRQD
jgi:4-amino-4-deoxy-L-arabinose transferase-like glycosyltransferase